MATDMPRRRWVPYLILIIGGILSILLWYDLYRHAPTPIIETYHPILGLVLGLLITVLIATIARSIQLAQARARSLKKMNENLKKEIAERISAEETKQKLEIALLQGQKLQAIGTLAGGIAHDFNNLLYAIIGYVEMAREDVEKGSVTYKNLGRVLEAGHRGQELVSRILAFSRRQHHHHEALALKATIEAALSFLKPTIPASVIIDFHSEQDAQVLANQTQLHQVIVNLINNAVDAMDGEGHIDIKLSHLDPTNTFLKQFPDARAIPYCRIDVTDTGHGMDKQTMERIFDPFFTTKEVGKGTGLGLSIVHTIIKEHEGEITVSSQLGHGSIFTILLPEYIPQGVV